MSEQLLPCPSKTCGIRKSPCGDLKNVTDPDDLPCSGLSSVIQELREGLDRSSEGPQAKEKNPNGELSLEELQTRQHKLQKAVDDRVGVQGETVSNGQPPCEDGNGNPIIGPFGRPKR